MLRCTFAAAMLTMMKKVMADDPIRVVIEDSEKRVFFKNAIYVDDSTINDRMYFNYSTKIDFDGGIYFKPSDNLVWWIT